MVSAIGKKNKHTSVHDKCKASQKIRQHHREVKKTLKTQTPQIEKQAKIAKNAPIKAALMKEIELSKAKEREALEKRRVAYNAMQKTDAVTESTEIHKDIKDSSRAFVGDVKKLMDEANVIIEVLDARDPMGTRSIEVEKEVKLRNKTLVFVLNKIDLVPAENMRAWLRVLCKEARVFPFKASCQQQARNVGGTNHVPHIGDSGSSAAFGVDDLINHLKSLTKGPRAVNQSLDKLVVGVVGVPNTGKSSLINSLRRKRICEAGNTPGLTRVLQHIALDKHVTLIDSPGIVLSRTADPAEFALRNCVRAEKLDDPVAVAAAVFRRCPWQQLQAVYKVGETGAAPPAFETFLVAVASRCCPLKRGGVADVRLAALRIVNDWNGGRIAYCSEPPAPDAPEEAAMDTGTEDAQ